MLAYELRLRAFSRERARARSVALSRTLRTRMASGVTSTHSSAPQNSIASSRESLWAAASVTVASAVAERMFVSFFSLVMLMSMSSSRGFWPTTMPS